MGISQTDRHMFAFQEITYDVVLSIVNKFKPSNTIDIYEFSSNL